MAIRKNSLKKCELQGCKSKGKAKDTVGRFQVYDTTNSPKGVPTLSRPAHLCQRCRDFAKTCGMTPRSE